MKTSTINKKEIEKFSRIAEEWWDPAGKFKPLHKFNPIRISYIKEKIISSFKLENSDKPLQKIRLLDIGCGGGLLSEPMSRLGAEVTGIDASEKNIQVAKLHAKKNNLKINYLTASPENLKIDRKFDRIQREVDDLKNSVIHDYVLKEDFLREMQAVHTKLDRILDHLLNHTN